MVDPKVIVRYIAGCYIDSQYTICRTVISSPCIILLLTVCIVPVCRKICCRSGLSYSSCCCSKHNCIVCICCYSVCTGETVCSVCCNRCCGQYYTICIYQCSMKLCSLRLTDRCSVNIGISVTVIKYIS